MADDDKLSLKDNLNTNHSTGVGTIAISSIFIGDRVREKTARVVNHINIRLAPSIAIGGLIHPVVLTWNPTQQRFELIAGWCRIQAFIVLGHEEIPYVLREEMNDTELRSLELEENTARLEMTWQEEAMGILDVYEHRHDLAAARGQNFTLTACGKLLNVSAAKMSLVLPVAKLLKAKDAEVWACPNITSAQQLVIQRQERLAVKLLHEMELAQQGKPPVPATTTGARLPSRPPGTPAGTKPSDTSGPIGEDDFDFELLPANANLEKVAATTKAVSEVLVPKNVELSKILHKQDCREFLAACEPCSLDLVYTDPPFGIDMDMLSEVKGIGTVVKSHQVEENLALLQDFIPLAYRALKQDSFMLMWCDLKHWEKLTAWGEAAGFKVLQWPFLWCKPPGEAKNDASWCNPTKATEYVMFFRKGAAALKQPLPTNYMICSVKGERHEQQHPFIKPFAVSAQLIKATCPSGGTVFDGFVGGGSLLRAAVNLGFPILGCENDDTHFPGAYESLRGLYKEISGGACSFS